MIQEEGDFEIVFEGWAEWKSIKLSNTFAGEGESVSTRIEFGKCRTQKKEGDGSQAGPERGVG